MSDFAATAALILVVLAVFTAAAALIIKDYRSGSLQADIGFARAYIRTEFAHYKHSRKH